MAEAPPPTSRHSSVSARHPEWTHESISRFWAYWSQRADHYGSYFSYQVGEAVVNLADRLGVLRGDVLDYGCGPGFLVHHLLDRDVTVRAFEFSDAYVDVVTKRAAGRRGWAGLEIAPQLPTPYPDASFDLIFCLETLEHLTDDVLNPVLRELYRLCRPGGSVFITTPHAERLEEGFVYCPFCDSEFHQVQHQRAFDVDTMRAAVAARGFTPRYAAGVDLRRFQTRYTLGPLQSIRPRRVLDWARSRAASLGDRLTDAQGDTSRTFRFLAQPGPNLVMVAQRL